MCILLVAIDRVPGRPLLLLGNRDEFRERATALAAPWQDASLCVGGRDLRAGGSWLAQHGNGRFAAVTNLRSGLPATAPRSRGALVSEFVLGQQPGEVFLTHLRAHFDDYGPFNLVVGDPSGVWLLDGTTLDVRALYAGVHVISNGAVEAIWPKTTRLAGLFHAALAAGSTDSRSLLALLMDTDQPADSELPDTGVGHMRERLLAPVFIRGEHYGTRAATLLWHADDGGMHLHERSFDAEGISAERAWRHETHAASWQHE